MTDTNIEDALRQAFDLLADQTVPRSVQFETVARRAAARRRHRGSVAALSAVVVLAAVVVGTSLATSQSDRQSGSAQVHAPTCPARLPPAADSSSGHDTAASLVPAGARVAEGCRYLGLSQARPAGTLTKSVTLPPNVVGELAAAMNAAPRVPPGTVYHCPADFGDRSLVLFGYANGTTETVEINLSGCHFMYSSTGSAFWTPEVTTLLGSLAAASPLAH